MKCSNRTGVGSSIRRSVSILLIFATLALTNVSKAADFKNGPAEQGTMIALTNLSDRGGAHNLSQVLWGTVCYTPFGSAPMLYPMPVGSSCHVGYVSGVVGL